MFGVSLTEFIIILMALFLFVGPKRLSESSYEIGKWVGKLKSYLKQIREVHLGDFDTSTLYEAKTELNKSLNELSQPTQNEPPVHPTVPKTS